MGVTSFVIFVLRYLRSSLKLALCGDFPELQLLLVILLCILLVYLNLSFNYYTEKELPYQNQETEPVPPKYKEEVEDLFIDEEIEIPPAFRKEYNFLRENAKSLTTLFENYIQKRVSHDTLLKQFQASQENTFLQMKARCNSEHELAIEQDFSSRIMGGRGAAEQTDQPKPIIVTNKSDQSRAAGDTPKRTVTFKLP